MGARGGAIAINSHWVLSRWSIGATCGYISAEGNLDIHADINGKDMYSMITLQINMIIKDSMVRPYNSRNKLFDRLSTIQFSKLKLTHRIPHRYEKAFRKTSSVSFASITISKYNHKISTAFWSITFDDIIFTILALWDTFYVIVYAILRIYFTKTMFYIAVLTHLSKMAKIHHWMVLQLKRWTATKPRIGTCSLYSKLNIQTRLKNKMSMWSAVYITKVTYVIASVVQYAKRNAHTNTINIFYQVPFFYFDAKCHFKSQINGSPISYSRRCSFHHVLSANTRNSIATAK